MSKRNGNGAHALKLDPHNARKHPDRNKAQIAASLKELGAGRSILVDATDTIIAGNGVYEQAQALGYKVKVIEADGKTLIAVKRPDLKGAKARRMALADNRTTETSEWDVDVLADLAANDADALAGLFDERELRDLLGDKMPGGKEETADAGELVDKAAELQAKWQVQRGDVWQVGKHRVMCGDSTNAADAATLMQGERARLLWTDPPYHVGKDFGEYDEGNTWDDEFQKAWMACAIGALDTDAQRYICFAQARSREAILCYAPKRLLVWCKPFALMRANEWDWAYEFVAWCYDTDKPTYFDKPRGTASFDWQNIASVIHGQEGKYHITQKPIALPTGHITASSRRDEIILDVFSGSGTTLVACEQTGRIGRGMEIEPKYVAVTLERLTALGLQPKRVTDTNGNGKTKETA